MADAPKPARKRLPLFKKLVFALVPLGVALMIAELALQISRGEVFANYRLMRVELMKRGYPAERDLECGYVPLAGYASRDNHWGTQVTIDEHGLRTNGPEPSPDGRTILAVGDSFTFGDEVNDHETWPARLESELGQPVRNGGVFGYSLGQSILRAETMLRREPDAEWLIVSLIPNDIARCEMSKKFTLKPYFDIVDGALVLHPNPGPEPEPTPEQVSSRRWRDLLGHSALLDSVFAHGSAETKIWWFVDDKETRVHPPGKGVEIALHLVDRIATKCRETDTKLMFLIQGRDLDDAARKLMDHARASSIPVLDVITPFREEEKNDPDVHDRYFDSHMTAEGNTWVARHVARFLREQG